jgi:hypothetical protein
MITTTSKYRFTLDIELLAAELTKVSGTTWVGEEVSAEDEWSHSLYVLTAQDDSEMGIWARTYDGQKIKFKLDSTAKGLSFPNHSIFCAITKSPKVLAKEIHWRLIQKALDEYKSAHQRYVDYRNHVSRCQDILRALAEKGQVNRAITGDSTQLLSYGRVRELIVNSPESIELKVRVTEEEAHKILDLLF